MDKREDGESGGGVDVLLLLLLLFLVLGPEVIGPVSFKVVLNSMEQNVS